MDIRLGEREAEVLRQVLTNYLGNFRMEIRDTENYDWRQSMKEHEAAIKSILEKLSTVPTA